mgnify:CR=1 FL=1
MAKTYEQELREFRELVTELKTKISLALDKAGNLSVDAPSSYAASSLSECSDELDEAWEKLDDAWEKLDLAEDCVIAAVGNLVRQE